MRGIATASTALQGDGYFEPPLNEEYEYLSRSSATFPVTLADRNIVLYIVKSDEGINAVSASSTAPKKTEDCSEVDEVIENIRKENRFSFSPRLADRIEFLAEVGESPEEQPLALGSLKYFLRFLESAPNLAYPDIMLSTYGNLRVQWRKSRKEHFAAEFLPDGDVRFVVFTQNKKHENKVTRVSGLATTDMLTDAVENYGVLGWALSD